MDTADNIRSYKDRLRIFLIIYLFAEDFSDNAHPSRRKLFKSEVRIQKIDFLIRNPDYLAYELLIIAKQQSSLKIEIKKIVKSILEEKEPLIRRLEMERFFYGAYEDIDDVIAFLKSIGFVEFSSKKSRDLRTIEKHYYITDLAIENFENKKDKMDALKWYINRCDIIRTYFGDLKGTDLKVSQYKIDEYRNTSYNDYISSIYSMVLDQYQNLYKESL
jgi:DNA-binding PadR family transcriptional regulator